MYRKAKPCGNSGIFVENSASEKYFSDSGKWPFHTPPIHTPTKCRPILRTLLRSVRLHDPPWCAPYFRTSVSLNEAFLWCHFAPPNVRNLQCQFFWGPKSLARPLCRNVSRTFVVYILEDFAGDFPGGFFWAPFFPTKMRRKKSGDRIREKIRRPKIKIRKKSALPKTDPKKRLKETDTSF